MTTALLVIAALLGQTNADTKQADQGPDLVAVPVINYSSDVGFGLGVAGQLFIYGDKKPYAHALSAQVLFTTGGVQSHYLTYDAPHLLGPVRLEVHAEFNRNKYQPYYGPGNISQKGVSLEPGSKSFSYDTTFPVFWLRLRFHPLGDGTPLEPYVEYRWRTTSVTPYAGSLLETAPPFGSSGGKTPMLIIGVLNDTRDQEGSTTAGGMEELALRVSAPIVGSDYNFFGVTLSEIRFFSLWTPKVVFAERIVFDAMFGDVPFFVWPRVGGLEDTEGLGGGFTVRGLPLDRYQGNVKLFSNSELRFLPFQVHVFGQPLDIGGAGFFDVGRAWHPGGPNGTIADWHSGAGGGLRFVRRSAVIRLDIARDLEEPRTGFYFSFGQMF